MELIYEELLIKLANLVGINIVTHKAEDFSSSELELESSVIALEDTLCGESTSVHLKIKLTVPGFEVVIVLEILVV